MRASGRAKGDSTTSRAGRRALRATTRRPRPDRRRDRAGRARRRSLVAERRSSRPKPRSAITEAVHGPIPGCATKASSSAGVGNASSAVPASAPSSSARASRCNATTLLRESPRLRNRSASAAANAAGGGKSARASSALRAVVSVSMTRRRIALAAWIEICWKTTAFTIASQSVGYRGGLTPRARVTSVRQPRDRRGGFIERHQVDVDAEQAPDQPLAVAVERAAEARPQPVRRELLDFEQHGCTGSFEQTPASARRRRRRPRWSRGVAARSP